MRLRDYFVVTRENGRRAVRHMAEGCEWEGDIHGRNYLEVDEIMSLVARHDEDCPCAEG